MKRPYIICHMMMSIDGRIDCAMTEQIHGANEYCPLLEELNVPTTLSGRVTAQLEMAEPGEFSPTHPEIHCTEGFSKKCDAEGYEVVTDTNGKLLWKNDDKPLLIIMSTRASKEYIDYLDSRNISWIVEGTDRIDLNRAMEILYEAFGVKRMAVVGGGNINGGFLDAGLLVELSILIGPAVDGRKRMGAVIDGRTMQAPLVQLKLLPVKQYEDEGVWLRYAVEK